MPLSIDPTIIGINTSKFPGSFGAVTTITSLNEPRIIGLDPDLFPASSFLQASPTPAILNQPNSVTGSVGYPLTLQVDTVGSTSYRWFKNNISVINPTATTPTLTINSYALSDAGDYTCEITNTVPGFTPTSIISAVATVS